MRSLSFLPLLLAGASRAEGVWRRALTADSIVDYAENILIVKDDVPGFFVEVEVGGNVAVAQVDFSTGDLFVAGKLTGAALDNTATALAATNSYPFLDPPANNVEGATGVTNVSIGGKNIQQAFAWSENIKPFQSIASAFPQAPVVGVLGFGQTPLSAVANGARKGHSPIDTLVSTSAANPYVTIFFIGSEAAWGSSEPTFAGFFSVGEPVNLGSLLPDVNGQHPPDVSAIEKQPAIKLGAQGAFPVSKMTTSIGASDIPLTSGVKNAPVGTTTAILSTTEPWILTPGNIAHDIYGSVPGAAFDSQTGLWHVPCGTNLTVTVTIGGSTVVMDPESVIIKNPHTSQCVGSFKVISQNNGNWDISFGTAFLENVYVLYGYESKTDLSQPILKLLPYNDIQGASAYVGAIAPSGSKSATPSGATSTLYQGASSPTSSALPQKVAGNLDVESVESGTPNGPSGSIAEQLKHCLPAIVVLIVLWAISMIGAVIYCCVSHRRRADERSHSAYRSIHIAESGNQSRALYGHDEEHSKYSDPYHDRL